MHHGPQPNGYESCVKALTWVLQHLAGSPGSSLSCSASPCHSFKLSLLLALILSLRVFPLRSLTNQKTSCFWPLSFTEGHLIITATNATFRFARQYNRPTKPSPAPRTLQPDTKINQFFLKTLGNCAYYSVSGRAVCALTTVWSLSCLCVCWSWLSRYRSMYPWYITDCVPWIEEAGRTTDTSVIPALFLGDADWQEHYLCFT